MVASIPQLRLNLINGIDLGGQLIRIEGIKDALLEHQFPAILFPRTANEYGEFGFMYPHLFLYPLALLRICNVSLTTVYSSACFASNLVCVFLTFTAIKSITKSEYSAILATTLFTLVPAHIATITQDGSMLGSGFAAMFLALTLAGTYQILFEDYRKWWYLTLGLTGVFQSHLVTTLILLISICILFLCFIHKLREKERILSLFKSAFFFIMINLWYIIPFLYYYSSDSIGLGAIGDNYVTFPLRQLLLTSKDYLLSFLFWLAGIYYLISSRKNKMPFYSFLVCLVVIDCLFLLMSTSILPWELLRAFPPIRFFTSTLQFVNRFYILTDLIGIIFFSILLSQNIKSHTLKHISIAFAFIAMLLINCKGVMNYINDDQIMITQKIGYLQPYFQREYLPPNTEDSFFAGKSCTLSSDTDIYAENYIKHGSQLTFSYFTELTDAYVEVPLFYFNDYRAQLDDRTPVKLIDGTHHKIRIVLPQTDVLRTVTLSFEASPMYKFWILVSLLSTGFCIYLVKKRRI